MNILQVTGNGEEKTWKEEELLEELGGREREMKVFSVQSQREDRCARTCDRRPLKGRKGDREKGGERDNFKGRHFCDLLRNNRTAETKKGWKENLMPPTPLSTLCVM